MRINHGMIYNGDFCLEAKDLILEDGKIKAILKPGAPYTKQQDILNARDLKILPGLIDIHIHGSRGADTMDGTPEALQTVSRHLASQGVTAFLPTTMTTPIAELEQAFNNHPVLDGAQALGFNMEGPFISPKKRGAHLESCIRKPTAAEFSDYLNRAKIKVVTIAPEMPGALDFISRFGDQVVCSIGHTTADYDTAMEAIRRGARSLTHTFNAMPPLLHRDPGVIGAAVKSGIYGELIADGVHIHPAVVYCAYRLFGDDRLILISDAMRAAGLPDGHYELGGQPVLVNHGVARTEDGTIAGGTSNVWIGLKNAVNFGIPESSAVKMVTRNPARLIGEYDHKGSIEEGKDADLILLRDDLTLEHVIIGGKRYE
ncbi:MAG: N-acetylglucosamine-6-phosphate deacetylase [Oscillospiraceae bacterium]|nr:N-acetylglucosamine-6-phosphate deacetylase [Oscillospiraceae bacterium]